MSLKDKILLENSPVMDKKISNPKTGRKIKVSSALAYPKDEPVRKKAEQMLKGDNNNLKDLAPGTSLKAKTKNYGVSKECANYLKEKGYKKLSILPQSHVKINEIVFNPKLKELGAANTWVAKFPAYNADGTTKIVYTRTPEYSKKAQIKNFKHCSKIKEDDIIKLEKNTSKLLKNKNKKIADAACILKIIAETGLRVGSLNEAKTGNVGVRTLRKEHFEFDGDKIHLKFIGKSSVVNAATINDKELADYLKKNLKDKESKDNAFEASYGLVTSMLKKVNPKDIKPKNLRTYKATKYARELCAEGSPPPIKATNPKEIKKEVSEKLKDVFTKVAALLNNTPSMAQGSYVHPAVITEYLKSMNLKPVEVGYKHKMLDSIIMHTELNESEGVKEIKKIELVGMDEFFENSKEFLVISKEDEESITDEEECEEFLLPEWWDNDNWVLDFIKK